MMHNPLGSLPMIVSCGQVFVTFKIIIFLHSPKLDTQEPTDEQGCAKKLQPSPPTVSFTSMVFVQQKKEIIELLTVHWILYLQYLSPYEETALS